MGPIGKLARLEVLKLDDCKPVSDSGIKKLEGLTCLRELNVLGTRVTDAGMGPIGKLAGLEALDFDDCGLISGSGIEKLEGLTRLRGLSLLRDWDRGRRRQTNWEAGPHRVPGPLEYRGYGRRP